MFETASTTEAAAGICQDRVAIYTQADRIVIVVADGAGGSGSGGDASRAVIEEIQRAFPGIDSPNGWCNVLRQIDFRIGAGESTAVVVDLRVDSICGASVGDSQAWLINGADITDLTMHQHRKPLLGSGEADPVGFSCGRLNGLLIVATDGFCNYVKRTEMVKVIPFERFAELPRRLINLVRLRSGALIDDVGVVVCRQAPPARSRPAVYVLE